MDKVINIQDADGLSDSRSGQVDLAQDVIGLGIALEEKYAVTAKEADEANGVSSARETDHSERLGYDLHMVIPGFFSRSLGRQLQFDGLFFRRPS